MRELLVPAVLVMVGACGSSKPAAPVPTVDAQAEGARADGPPGSADAAAGPEAGDVPPADLATEVALEIGADRAGEAAAQDAAADATTTDAGATTTVTCAATGTVTTFSRACMVDLDCMIGYQQVDACGSLAALGLHRSEEKRWAMVEGACRTATPLVPCPAKAIATEDGKSGPIALVAATCEAGRCQTCTNCRPPPPPQ